MTTRNMSIFFQYPRHGCADQICTKCTILHYWLKRLISTWFRVYLLHCLITGKTKSRQYLCHASVYTRVLIIIFTIFVIAIIYSTNNAIINKHVYIIYIYTHTMPHKCSTCTHVQSYSFTWVLFTRIKAEWKNRIIIIFTTIHFAGIM